MIKNRLMQLGLALAMVVSALSGNKAAHVETNVACGSANNGKSLSVSNAKGAAPICPLLVKRVLDVEKMMDGYLDAMYKNDREFYANARFGGREVVLIMQSLVLSNRKHVERILRFGSEEQKSQMKTVMQRMFGKLDERTRQLREHTVRPGYAKKRRDRVFLSLGTAVLCLLGYMKLSHKGDPRIPGIIGIAMALTYGAAILDEREYDHTILLYKNACFTSLEYMTRTWKEVLEETEKGNVQV